MTRWGMPDPHRRTSARSLVRKWIELNVGPAIAGIILVILGIRYALEGDAFRAAWGIVGGTVLAVSVIVTNIRRCKSGPSAPPPEQQ